MRSRHGLTDEPAPADHSPPSSSGATTPAGFGSRPGHKGSHLSLQHLGEVFTPANFYNEVRIGLRAPLSSQSNVLKAAKANSQPGTPQHELYEKPKPSGMRRRNKKKQDEIFITSASVAMRS